MRYSDIAQRSIALLPDARRFLALSFLVNLITGALKLATGIFSASVIVITNGVYSLILCMAKLVQLFWLHGSAGSTRYTRVLNSAAIILLGVIFTLSGLHTYKSEKMLGYGMYSVLVLSLCTFVKLALSIYGVSKFRYDRENVMFSVKMTNLTDSLMSLVITQSAILSVAHREDAYIYDGVYGAFVGVAVTALGVGMLLYILFLEKTRKKGKKE